MSQLCRVVEEAKHNAREQREARSKPQPWIVLKLMVFITTGIMIYTGYVYIGRFCVQIILRQKPGVSRGSGIALLVVFCLLYLWMFWAYARVVLTPPGFARDYVAQCPPPVLAPQPYVPAPLDNNSESVRGPSYDRLERGQDQNAGVLDALPKPPMIASTVAAASVADPSPSPSSSSSAEKKKIKGKSLRQTRLQRDLDRAARSHISRRPPTTPPLAPEYRYCSKDLFIKPYRAHHCRACGTCVLKYDHHCPWIGQCVGARNHKFFINFNLATAFFTSYTLATLVGFAVHLSNGDIDVQTIVIIALAGLFFIFTITLFLSHARLLTLSQTTVEHLQTSSIKEHEDFILSEIFSCWEIPNKQRVRREWDKEWGRVGREGNVWWAGSPLRGWEDTMGSAERTRENPWGWASWVFPLGLRKRKEEVGLEYRINPRCDGQGRWRKRSEWPEELR
ncbi:hypothetical protein D9757_008130 [Collybiopsis confluens]|uniref:Palmitoyltransferase n=1 Tax=Collybiopsis confluens TaxID=2823264 RepID=A0A8H5M5J1_9AGAR|nr:hypothetical protein D9757_008130 [Collybiopsis confluens]